MARVSAKFTPVYESDLRMYYNNLQSTQNSIIFAKRSKNINNWNKGANYLISQGKTTLLIKTNEFFLDKKLGMFSKTRKPFFFRSKRRKKCDTNYM